MGRVVFLSSESALNIPADMIHYGFSKTANLSVSRGLAKRLAGTGVTVNAVLPGPTLTEGVAEMLREDAQKAGQSIEEAGTAFVRQHRSSSIIQRLATPEEVANLVVYACSTQASATTGAALRVDGGARQPGLTSAQRQRKMLLGTRGAVPGGPGRLPRRRWRRRS